MINIQVSGDGTGDFVTIAEALLAVPYDCEAVIEIGPGVICEMAMISVSSLFEIHWWLITTSCWINDNIA